MATAIEYGLIAALIAVTGIAAVQCTIKPSKPNTLSAVDNTAQPVSITPLPILRLVNENADETQPALYEDVETGCKYIVTPSGITIRYQSGLIDCPVKVIPESIVPQKR